MRILFAVLLTVSWFSAVAQFPIYTWEQAKNADPDTVLGISFAKSKLESLPEALFKFNKLQHLDLSKNKLSRLPLEFNQLSDLIEIDISSNRFDNFPIVLTQLKNLRSIIANRNNFDRLPESFGELKNLETIDFWDTPVYYFPESMYSITSLRKLDLSGIRYSPSFQEKLKTRLPATEIVFDAPCDCME